MIALPQQDETGLTPRFVGSKLLFCMPDDSRLSRSPLTSSLAGTSRSSPNDENVQLSSRGGVEINVSTAAMDRGILMAAMGPQAAASLPAAVTGGESSTDAEVMLRVKAGDQSAFDYLVQKYRRPLVNFMYRMARNPRAAEDLAQEVFLRVYRSREELRGQRQIHHLAVSHRHEPGGESRARHPARTSGSERGPRRDQRRQQYDHVELPDGSLTAEQAMVQQERLQAIRSKVEALPEQQRLAVIMHKYQQMDYKQIAEVLKKSESATKSLLFRAYETLRDQLKEFYENAWLFTGKLQRRSWRGEES